MIVKRFLISFTVYFRKTVYMLAYVFGCKHGQLPYFQLSSGPRICWCLKCLFVMWKASCRLLVLPHEEMAAYSFSK